MRDFESNPRVVRLEARKLWKCSWCPANASENQHKKSKVRNMNVVTGKLYGNVSWKTLRRRHQWVG